MRKVIFAAAVAAALSGCATAPVWNGGGSYNPNDVWQFYVPPAPDRDPPPPFSTGSWILYGTYDSIGCVSAGMALHYKAWNDGDRDLSMRALDGGCYNPRTGEWKP